MRILDKRLIRMIRHSKGQFISIVVIVIVALAIYILFNITNINIRNAVDDYYEMTNSADLQIELLKIPTTALQDIRRIDGVLDVEGRLSFDVPLKVDNKDERVTVRLMSMPDKPQINKLYLIEGETASPRLEEGLLLQQFAVARNIGPSQVITPVIGGREYPLTVKAVVSSSEFIYLMENEQALMPNPDKFGIFYVNQDFAQSVYGYSGYFNEVLVTLEDSADADEIIKELEIKLDAYGVKRMIKFKDQLSNNVLVQKMDGIEKMASVIPILFLGVGAIIIIIMLSRIVSNDRIPIGVLKALGYSNSQVLIHYTGYALSIGIVGSIIGILVGLGFSGPLSKVFVFYFNIPFVHIAVYPGYIISALVLTSSFCVFAGLLGARGILKIMPADSMRSEAPKSGKRILLERIPLIWRHVSFSWKMVIRNIARMKRRFILLTFGLAMAYAINTVPLYMGNAVPTMFDIQYNKLQKMDYSIEFNRPMNQSVLQDLKHLVKTTDIEPKLQSPFELKYKWYEKASVVIGVPSETRLMDFEDVSNKPIRLKVNRIYLTEGLATLLHVSQGETIAIASFVPGRADVHLEVGEILHQYLGSNAYMEITTMQDLMLNPQLITGVNLTSKDDVKEKLKNVTNIALIRSASDVKNSFLEYMDTLIVATNAYMIFGAILGFAIIYNATVIGISERKMEFSSLRVMGFDKKEVFKIVTRENSLLAICSVLLGIPLGMAMISGMAKSFSSEMITLPSFYSPKIFVIAAVATVVYVIIAQFATRTKIFNLDFIEALKSRIS